MASSFTAAAIFDVVALLVVAAAVRIANPSRPDRQAVREPAPARAAITAAEETEALRVELLESELHESEVVG